MDAATSHRYRSFAAWARESSPLYAEWADSIAGDPGLIGRIAALGERRGQPNLVFAAARWAGCGIEPFPRWRENLIEAWDRVAAITAERRTQTNEVGRCATLLPVISRIDGPVALLETGTAAGLCLFPERYSYAYASPAGEHVLRPPAGAGTDVGAGPMLGCRVDAADVVPETLPDVVWRAGIDLAPIDVRDEDAVAWLETLVWPGPVYDERLGRLRAGVEVARTDPPRIVAGDILDRLPELADESPREATLVVFHSAVLMYLDADARLRFTELVRALGQRTGRRVVWISNEAPGILPEADERMPQGVHVTGSFIQTVDGVPVALAGQHGATYEVASFRP